MESSTSGALSIAFIVEEKVIPVEGQGIYNV